MGVDPKIQRAKEAEEALNEAQQQGGSTAEAEKEFDAAMDDLLKDD